LLLFLLAHFMSDNICIVFFSNRNTPSILWLILYMVAPALHHRPGGRLGPATLGRGATAAAAAGRDGPADAKAEDDEVANALSAFW
jgi:hypothetical protein